MNFKLTTHFNSDRHISGAAQAPCGSWLSYWTALVSLVTATRSCLRPAVSVGDPELCPLRLASLCPLSSMSSSAQDFNCCPQACNTQVTISSLCCCPERATGKTNSFPDICTRRPSAARGKAERVALQLPFTIGPSLLLGPHSLHAHPRAHILTTNQLLTKRSIFCGMIQAVLSSLCWQDALGAHLHSSPDSLCMGPSKTQLPLKLCLTIPPGLPWVDCPLPWAPGSPEHGNLNAPGCLGLCLLHRPGASLRTHAEHFCRAPVT